MKLLTRTTLYFLLALIPLLAAGGYYLFRQFSREINAEVDQELLYDEIQWVGYVQHETAINGRFVLKTPELLIYPVDALPDQYPTITDMRYYQESLRTTIPYRQLAQIVPVNGSAYQIIIRRSQIQKSLLVSNVTRIMLFVFAGLFLATILFNWFISRRLWRPFQQSLEKIRHVELQNMQALHFGETRVEEFNALNASLNTMANKIHADFLNMKEFTEDAAHEMQTPLAIAQSKLELLLQDPALTNDQAQYVVQCAEAITRLSRLNQSLLLLAKIENNQYQSKESVNLNVLTRNFISSFRELIDDKSLTVELSGGQDFVVNLHPLLAESLVSNLIGNAVKYNYTGGRILIHFTDHSLAVSNTSHLPQISPEQLFKRFSPAAAGSKAAGATGLGLAIVKKIVDTHHLRIEYGMKNDMQHFVISKTD